MRPDIGKTPKLANMNMKIQLLLFVLSNALWLDTPALLAQTTTTNSPPLNQTVKYQTALENDRARGEHALLPPGLKEKLRLTDEQRAELKPIEDDFADTSEQYQIANQPRIAAAQEANHQARVAQDVERIQAARRQLQEVWAGLDPARATAVLRIKPLLTPGQITILEDPDNQWHENQGTEANDPSAN